MSDPAPSSSRKKLRLKILIGLLVLVALIFMAQPWWLPWLHRVQPLDPLPAAEGKGRLARQGPHVVLHLAGTPQEMGRQHGALLKQGIRYMIDEYLIAGSIVSADPEDPRRKKLMEGLRALRSSLPSAFVEELDACAAAAEVDPDLLLLAQCEGEVAHVLHRASHEAPLHACSSYAAFGAATADGHLECGRNLDYQIGKEMGLRCALVTYYQPAQGYRFAAVGASGILTGWTVINEHGLIAANHLGGGGASRKDGLPTLILLRQIAQHCKDIDEGLARIEASKRMSGQIVWLAQEADPASGRKARAVAVEYDAERVVVREARNGVLVVTNTNLAFDQAVKEEDVACGRFKALRTAILDKHGHLDGMQRMTETRGVVNGSTLHLFHCVPSQHCFWVRHQTLPGNLAEPVRYTMLGEEGHKQ